MFRASVWYWRSFKELATIDFQPFWNDGYGKGGGGVKK